MAFANFFDKTSLAASQVLRGVSASDFQQRLEGASVCLSVGTAQPLSFETRTCLEIATNLTARFYPTISFDFGQHGREYEAALRTLASEINPVIEFGEPSNSTYALVIGDVRPSGRAECIHIGSDRWTARVSSSKTLHCADSENPIGAAAAGCLGVANLFRLVFANELPSSSVDIDSEISFIEYDTEQQSAFKLDSGDIDLGSVHLVGAGAVGCAALWTLARCKWVHGTIHVIDPETIAQSNLQRYILSTQSDASQSLLKVDIAKGAVEHLNSRLKVRPHPKAWGEFAYKDSDWVFERVAVAVDSAIARREVQASLPREVINAWTGSDGDVGISRHVTFGKNASCLCCLYRGHAEAKNFDQIVAESLNIANVQQVRKLLHTGEPLTEESVSQIAVMNGILPDTLKTFVGKPLIVFYNEAICGGLLFRLGGKAAPEVEVPMAFQSALAGIMLAAELLARAAEPYSLRKTLTRLSLLRPIPDVMSFNVARDTSGQCICHDQDFIGRYVQKYLIRAPVPEQLNQ